MPAHKPGDAQGGAVSRFINPGEFYFCGSNCQIHTILGSCIAITLWHPVLRIGGMCHFVLPGRRSPAGVIRAGSELDGRYSDAAIALFERAATEHGTSLQEYQAKIFGGSDMLARPDCKGDKLIGVKNAKAALKHLTERGIILVVADVGGTGHRHIAFDVKCGDVWVKHVSLQKKNP